MFYGGHKKLGTKNRDRVLEADIAKEFLARVVEQAPGKGLTSDEHFTVDGTLLEAWASAKSFQPKDAKQLPPPDDPGNPTVNFRTERPSNETHESKTHREALLARKGQGKESPAGRQGRGRPYKSDGNGLSPVAAPKSIGIQPIKASWRDPQPFHSSRRSPRSGNNRLPDDNTDNGAARLSVTMNPR
jgi:hypothetical protein